MSRFPDDVEKVLRAAGWAPGRKDDQRARHWGLTLSAWASPAGHQHTFSRAATAALSEFGGLVVDQSGPGVDVARTPFVLDPERALPTWLTLRGLGAVLGVGLFPLGIEDDGASALAIDTTGRVFALDHTAEWLLGVTIDEALTTLVLGRRPARVRVDGTVG
ncbi:SUKH-3 domain-containing protein [Cryptosporangium aurantiacum]|uniref:SUKH-3 immunity protein n=1 Tax=Cryptosporangium aurantiacum TaxID=134849 RepID=A0A1M7NH84_9ACTN|nr:SUKH-3 domain-containing protein [Cryptosporangium aurantiacum]SHN03081.1 SUKH-3 immunity protein [Cryptosporangium aurantiacum]